jgi:hypothetical protein
MDFLSILFCSGRDRLFGPAYDRSESTAAFNPSAISESGRDAVAAPFDATCSHAYGM